MLKNAFVIILKFNFLEILLGISINKKNSKPKSRVPFYLESGIFHKPGRPKDTLLAKTLNPGSQPGPVAPKIR